MFRGRLGAVWGELGCLRGVLGISGRPHRQIVNQRQPGQVVMCRLHCIRPVFSSQGPQLRQHCAQVLKSRDQRLTLFYFSAQRKRLLWDRGCIEGLFRGFFCVFRRCRGVFGDVKGVFRVRYDSG